MSSKAKRKKELHARKQAEKKRKKERVQARHRDLGSGIQANLNSYQRYVQRLQRQVPVAWTDESREDVAIFDDSVLQQLDAEHAQQALLVRTGLQEVANSAGATALVPLAVIPRTSPFAEWRLFLRGLADWLDNKFDAAKESWKRLSSSRRPARIAQVFELAFHPDLQSLNPDNPDEVQESIKSLDSKIIEHARLLHRYRIERPAFAHVERIFSMPDEVDESESAVRLTIGFDKLKLLSQFAKDNVLIEPELTAAASEIAILLAASQPFGDIFTAAIEHLPGPPHDPQNHLRAYFYYQSFSDSSSKVQSEKAFERFISFSLKTNPNLTDRQKQALACQLYLHHAERLGGQRPLAFIGSNPDQAKLDKQLDCFQKAIAVSPTNSAAHEAYVEWIDRRLESSIYEEGALDQYAKMLTDAMNDWATQIPTATRPRVYLVDHYFESDQIEQAKSHVQFLSGLRHDDPEVRAIPWKWHLLEAQLHCRKKGTVVLANSSLAEAEKLWPSWIGRPWLVYLRWAVAIRAGQLDKANELHTLAIQESGWQADSLADACLCLGAAQTLKVPSPELKEYRLTIDRHLKSLSSVSTEELSALAACFWDLTRTKLLYPSYRASSPKIGKELVKRWNRTPMWLIERRDEINAQNAALWCSDMSFWETGHTLSLPAPLVAAKISDHPVFIAAKLNCLTHRYYSRLPFDRQKLSAKLLADADEQNDPFRRFWYKELAEENMKPSSWVR